MFSAVKYLDKVAIFSHIHNLSTKEAEVGNSGRRRESSGLTWDTSQSLSKGIRKKNRNNSKCETKKNSLFVQNKIDKLKVLLTKVLQLKVTEVEHSSV